MSALMKHEQLIQEVHRQASQRSAKVMEKLSQARRAAGLGQVQRKPIDVSRVKINQRPINILESLL